MSWRYTELDTAFEWGMRPGAFDELNSDERGEMVAYIWTKRALDSWHYEQAEKQAQSKAAKK